jgi:hypothetical protein
MWSLGDPEPPAHATKTRTTSQKIWLPTRSNHNFMKCGPWEIQNHQRMQQKLAQQARKYGFQLVQITTS